MVTTDAQSAAARLAGVRQDRDIIIRARTSTAPFEPAFGVTRPIDVLTLMERALGADESETSVEWVLRGCSNDALHLATARAYELQDFAATDRGFRDVPTPMIWLIRDDMPGLAVQRP